MSSTRKAAAANKGKGSRKNKTPQTPAALNAHQGWTLLEPSDFDPIDFDMQNLFLDDLLTARVNNYVQYIRRRFSDKLRVNLLEPTELNVFSLLISPALEDILEYTNESINVTSCTPVSPSEFRRFLGTLLLSATFTLSMDHTFVLMETLTAGSNCKLDRFREILHNLKGYECSTRSTVGSQGRWDDQRNLLHNPHPLEQFFFERSINFFFDRENGCYVYDDELIASKAIDVELRTLSDRKTSGEGPTVDCLADAMFQIVLGMRLRTNATTQQENAERLTDRFPQIERNVASLFGPLLVMDRGFRKLKLIKVLAQKNYKIITIAATLGSEHPLVPSTALSTFRDKLKKTKRSKTDTLSDDEVDEDEDEGEPLVDAVVEFDSIMVPWTIPDDEKILLGPEYKVSRYSEDTNLMAVAIRDIFDKKVAQKVIRFFLCGFPEDYMPMVNKWLAVPKPKLRPKF
jgi:hypothetical protein